MRPKVDPPPSGQRMTALPRATRLGGSNKMLTVREVAELLSVSPDTIYDKWREWDLTGYHIGKHLRFREREVEAWITAQAA